jgi:ABC-type uncharacterized transport system involved in gliding motility auxiliary subunit
MGILKKLIDTLAPLGIAVALGVFIWTQRGHALPGGLRPWLVGALALVLLHIVLRWDSIVRGVGRRQLRYGTNALVLAILVLGILGFVNYFVSRHTKRFDLTKDQRFSLSDQTRKVLAGLRDKVKLTYFDRQQEIARGQDRLKSYQAFSSKIEIEYVDPVKSPTRAAAYDARGPYPILFVELGNKRERITNTEEQDVTNALIKVTREGKKTVCLIEGEGERSGGDTGERGFSGAKSSLTKSLYDVKDVFLLREKKVPSSCTVVIVAGPQNDLQPETTAALAEYVKGGGKALVMAEPELKESYPNLVALLKGWNLEAGKDVLIDRQGLSPFQPLVVDYPFHPITKDLGGVMTSFLAARSLEAGKATIDGVTAQNLVQTSAESWAKTDIAGVIKGKLTYDQKADRLGPIALAAVATVRVPTPASSPTPSAAPSPAPSAAPSPAPSPAAAGEGDKKPREGRVVAVGDADFASNQLLGFQGNHDLFLNMVAWLAEDADLISIRPKDPQNQTLFISRQTQTLVLLTAQLLIPGFFVVAGIVMWWRRR